MKIIRSLDAFSDAGKPVILAAGCFDGLHIGHTAVIRVAIEQARAIGGEAWVFTFDPHPAKVLIPDRAPPLIFTTTQQCRHLQEMGVDGCILQPFTVDFMKQEPVAFFDSLREHIPELAEKSPVFAELQNVFDLAVVAALLQREDWPRRLNWPMVTLLNAERWPVRQYPVPKAIDSLATTANRNRFVLGMVGGVTLDAGEVIGQRREGADAKTLATLREHATTTAKKPRPTWWDK